MHAAQLYSLSETPQSLHPIPPHLGSYSRALLVSPTSLYDPLVFIIFISGDDLSVRDSFNLTNSILASIVRYTFENETAEKGLRQGQPQVRAPKVFHKVGTKVLKNSPLGRLLSNDEDKWRGTSYTFLVQNK
jgi:hypothetical protein